MAALSPKVAGGFFAPGAPYVAEMPSGEARGVSPIPQPQRRPASPTHLLRPVEPGSLRAPRPVWRLRRLRSRPRTVLRDGAGRKHEVRLAELAHGRLLYAVVDGRTALCLAVLRRGEGDGGEEGLRWEVEEVRDGDDWVLALGRIRGRGRGSGVDVGAHGGWLATFRDGVITHFQTFPERGHALEAAGLRQ